MTLIVWVALPDMITMDPLVLNGSVYITEKLDCDQTNIFINDCHADMWRAMFQAGHAVASRLFSGRWPNLQH